MNIRQLFAVFSIVFLHFVIARPFNFPLTVAPFAVVFFFNLFFNFKLLARKNFLAAMVAVIVIYPFINSLEIGFVGGDVVQYFRTYALWITSAPVIATCLFAKIRLNFDLAMPALVSLIVVMSCVVLQSITSGLGDTSYFNFFGTHQYFGEIELATLAIDDRLRPPGFYLEPSFCAYVVTNLCAICLLQNRYKTAAFSCSLISLLLIQSLSGFIALILLGMVYVSGFKARLRSNLSFGVISFTSFVCLVWYFYGGYVADRFDQITLPGSSTYYRIIGLLPVLGDVLLSHPLGYSLGRVKEVIPIYAIPHGTAYGESIDNGLYLLVFYFGWLGFLFCGFMFYLMMSFYAKSKVKNGFLISIIFLGCFFNGGIMLPEFTLLTMFLIYAARSNEFQRV